MSGMMLIAYDADGNVIDTLDPMPARDEEGRVIGMIDFGAHELAGGEMTDVWRRSGAKGSKVWPEWIGSEIRQFRVELEGPAGRKRIAALVHIGRPESRDEEGNVIPAIPPSGHRRERTVIEAAIAERIVKANGEPADIRDIVGGPGRPLRLDDEGRTLGRSIASGTPAHLPLVGADMTPTPPAAPTDSDTPALARTPPR